LVLMLECNLNGSVHVSLGAVRRPRCLRPVGLEQRTGNVSNLEVVFGKDLLSFPNLRLAQVHRVFAPHRAQLNPAESKLARHDMADMIEIRRNLVVDHSNSKRRMPGLGPGLERAYDASGCGRCCSS